MPGRGSEDHHHATERVLNLHKTIPSEQASLKHLSKLVSLHVLEICLSDSERVIVSSVNTCVS